MEPDVAELAGRAHDLGHPPFGHIGEKVLDQIAVQNGLSDGFEGNAQSFRILTFLQRKLRDGMPVQGMDLTNVSTASIVKYPWSRGDSGKKYRKFNYYDIDIDRFKRSVSPLLYCDDIGILEVQENGSRDVTGRRWWAVGIDCIILRRHRPHQKDGMATLERLRR